MNTIDRLFKYFHLKRINVSQLERECGFSKNYLGTQKNRGSDMGSSKLKTILLNCEDLSIDWLILNKGKMLKSKCHGSEKCQEKESFILEQQLQIENLNIELKKLREGVL